MERIDVADWIAPERGWSDRTRRLVDRLSGGRTAPLLAYLAKSNPLSDEDIVEIEALLKALRP